MKKLTAIILLICMLLTSLAACKKNKTEDVIPGVTPESVTPPTSTPAQPATPTIVVPEYKDYGRGTVDFGSIIYTRPGIQALTSSFESVAQKVEDNLTDASEQLADIRALEPSLSTAKTMYSLVQINQNKNASISFWKDEASYFGTYYPLLTQAVEKLLVACAKSEHKTLFESDYFGYSLDEYTDGGIYTDDVVALMQKEAELEAEYSSLSTATVEISYKRTGRDEPFVGTVDQVKAQLKEYFGTDTQSYNNVLGHIDTLYKQKLYDLTLPLYVELIKVRRDIADALGYSSYTELAYDSMGYDYSSSDMLALLTDVGEYVYAVGKSLTEEIFEGYEPPKVSITDVKLINDLYTVYSSLGGNYKDAYSYMLQHGLYDVGAKNENRYNGAFTTYLESNSSPYLFVTTSGLLSDYTNMAHEFGHFLDGYLNYGDEDSLAVMEISSQALELLTFIKLKGVMHTPEYKYLTYVTINTYVTNVLLEQSFIAAFEHMAYSLEADEITTERLAEIVGMADMLITGSAKHSLSSVIIPHTVLYPCYVESYVTSAIVSLDIFFAEDNKSGDGFAIYEALILRENKDLSFLERLEAVGLDSPFKSGKVMSTASSIYLYMTGKNYDFDGGTENAD